MIKIMDKFTVIRLKEAGRSIRSIARELKVDRKTVTRCWNEYQRLRNEAERDPSRDSQDSLIAKPSYNARQRKPSKYTAQIDAQVNNIIAFELEKKAKLGANKQALYVTDIHCMLKDQGYQISLSTLNNHIRTKLKVKGEAFIKQQYSYGYRLEFDFGEVKLLINGVLQKIMMAVFSAPASGFRWMKLYTNSKQEVFLDAHVEFFKLVGGVYKTVVYDNMKNVVKRFVGHHEKQLNDELVKLAIYYGFTPVVTNTYSGNEKGHVEGSVKIVRKQAFSKIYEFTSLCQAQQHANEVLLQLNHSSSIEQEKPNLLKLLGNYDYSIVQIHSVNKYSFISIDTNKYSVPEHLVGKQVVVKKYQQDLVVLYKGQKVCQHQRLITRDDYCIDIRHYLATLAKKPAAVEFSLALKSIPKLQRIFNLYFRTCPKEFIKILQQHQALPMQQIYQYLQHYGMSDKTHTANTAMAKAEQAARQQIQALSQVYLGASSHEH